MIDSACRTIGWGNVNQLAIWPYTNQVITGGEAAMTLHLKLATFPSCTTQLWGLRTNRGMASRRSAGKHSNVWAFSSILLINIQDMKWRTQERNRIPRQYRTVFVTMSFVLANKVLLNYNLLYLKLLISKQYKVIKALNSFINLLPLILLAQFGLLNLEPKYAMHRLFP